MTLNTAQASLLAKRQVLTVGITVGSYEEQADTIIAYARQRRSAYVCCVNAHMTVEATEPHFAAVVNQADLATPDGVPVLHALNRFHRLRQERVAGNDLMPTLLEKAAAAGVGVFLFGGSDETLGLIVDRARKEFPELRVCGVYSPPFAPLEKMDLIVEAARIQASGAGLVLVSLGCPKQERFMAAMKGKVDVAMVGLGGAFLLYAGVDKRAPKWMRDLALEWAYRLYLEPGRLWKRYLVTNARFIGLYLREQFRRKSHRAASKSTIYSPPTN